MGRHATRDQPFDLNPLASRHGEAYDRIDGQCRAGADRSCSHVFDLVLGQVVFDIGGLAMGTSVRSRAVVVAVALVLGACGGGGGARDATEPAGATSITLDAEHTSDGTERDGRPVAELSFAPPDAVTWTAAAEHEIAMVDEMRTELGLFETFGDDSPDVIAAWSESEAEFGVVTLPELATELGFDEAALAALTALTAPPVEGFASPRSQPRSPRQTPGGLVGDVAATGTMGMAMLTIAIASADTSRQMSPVERSEEYRKQVGGLSETVRITSTIGLETGGGRMRGTVRIRSDVTVADAAGTTVATLSGSADGSFEALACPEPDGVAAGRYQLTLEQSHTRDGTPVSSTRRIDAPFTLRADDAAELVEARFEATVEAQGRVGADDPWSATVTLPIAIVGSPQGEATETSHDATPDQIASAVGAALLPYVAISLAADAAEDFWRSGRCVDLVPTVQSRKVAPDEVVDFEVRAKQRFDGQAIERPITATLSGHRTLEPSATPVDPPAAFTYTAGSVPGETGTISIVQRSRRGIGRTTLTFEVEEHAVVVSVAATADWTPGGGVEAHGRMTIGATTARSDGSRTAASMSYAESFVVALGIGSCQAEHEAEVPVALFVEQDEASDTTFRVAVDISETDPADTAACEAAGVSVDVPTNAELFLFAWVDALQSGVLVELGQTAVVEGTDASGQIPYRIEVTVQPATR